jgi:hypothetical protein
VALSPLGQNTVSRAITAAKYLLETLKPILDELNVTYDSQGGLKSTIGQADLDGITSFSGLTKAQLDDGMYVLTATLRGDLANGYSALVQLAARSS